MSVRVVVPPPSTLFPKEQEEDEEEETSSSLLPLTPPDSPSSEDECRKTWRRRPEEEEEEEEGVPGCQKGVVPSGGVLIGGREEEWTSSSSSYAPPERLSRTTGHERTDPAARHGSRGGETVCVMQQKGGAQPPRHTCPTTTTTTTSMMINNSGGCGGGPQSHPPPPLRSVLKRSGQRSRGYRVSINESKNEVLEADYVIVVRDEEEPPQIVCVRTLDLNTTSPPTDLVTLSPPEGYKDVFGHPIHRSADPRDHNTEVSSAWGAEVHDPYCPRANLPDLVSHQHPRCPSTNLTVENVRNHDQLMLDSPQDDAEDAKVAKTGILKGGKYWKNGRRQNFEIPKAEKMEERRSVRFSGRDEFTTLDATEGFDNIPIEIANQAALACFLSPKFQELSNLLGEQRQEDWNLELSPLVLENALNNLDDLPHHYSCAKHGLQHFEDPKLNDEHISESVQRYDEMRRRIAVAEGRDNNSTCSDESKSSSDSQVSECHTTESRIRRMENADVAHLAGGVMRSNSEVRRAIQRNALRRSLIRFAEARKKDTNKNDRNDKQDNSLIEKLKWLTASEDATNGNADDKEDESGILLQQQSCIDQQSERHHVDEPLPSYRCPLQQYKDLTAMFNQTTSYRGPDIKVPGDVREWKMDAELFKGEKGAQDLEIDDFSTVTYTAVPAVSICDQISDEESEKLIYSGGVRYTKEGTLPTVIHPLVNETIIVTRECTRPNGETYTVDDIDEVLHDDHSSSVPSSSQSSPRLSGRSDVDGASTAESGYSSNETNSELGQILPPELDELAEFVKQDAGRMERLRRRFDEPEDHGFNRRPSVRGIKTRFGSTTDLLNQMANQLVPPPITQPSLNNPNMTWPYKESEEETGGSNQQRRRGTPSSRNTPLPALKEEGAYLNSVDAPFPVNKTGDKLLQRMPPRMYAGDLPPRTREEYVRQGPPPRAQSYTTLPQGSQFGSSQSLLVSPPSKMMIVSNDHHHSTCSARRPASVHGHAPTDMLMSGPQHSTPEPPRPFHYYQYNPSRPHGGETGHINHENSHLSLNLSTSYPSNSTSNISYNHSYHQTSPLDSDPCQRSSYAERSYCQGWHPSSNLSYVHSNSNNYRPPIVSSQMSYTMPIVPEGSIPRQLGIMNGIASKIDSERGVPEGASSTTRIALDSTQCSSGHHQPTRDSGLLLRQAMNVST